MVGLLDTILAARGMNSAPFNGAYPSPVQTYIDYSSGFPIEMDKPKASFGPLPASSTPLDGFGAGAAPFSFAGPGSMKADPSMVAQPAPAPAPAAPVVAEAPKAAPTDVSAAPRAPLSLAPPAPAAAATPAVEPPSFGDRLSNGLAANPLTLITLGSGIAQGGIGKGLQYAAAGAQADQSNRLKQATRTATYAALKARGMSDADALLAMQSPEALKAVLPKLFPTYESTTVGNTATAFNKADGTFKPGFTAPKYEKVGPGDTLYMTGGEPGNGGAPGAPVAVANGGPEKPPNGYAYRDPNDPSQGLVAQKGGPGDKIPAEVAARLGLAQSFLGQLPNIRKRVAAGELTGPIDGALGAMNIGGAGELRRQISSGSEALLRNLTGAGMNKDEAADYVKRYQPEFNDSPQTVLSKLTQLERELRSVDQIVSQGRSGPILSKTPSASDPLGIR